MSEPGRLIAAGRAAEVFGRGDGTVLRRYRNDQDTELEARIMRWLAIQGCPVPLIHAASRATQGRRAREGDVAGRPASARGRRGSAVLHLDLHPMNVMLDGDEPVVIDWTDVSRGDPGFGAAMSMVLMTGYETDAVRDRLVRPRFATVFSLRRGRRLIRRHLSAAYRHRLRDPNLTDGERRFIERRQGSRWGRVGRDPRVLV